MPSRSEFWREHGYASRAAYRAARRAAGFRTYPLESEQRAAREGRGYGHAGNAFVRQFRGLGDTRIIFENIVIRGWRYVKGRGWLQTRGTDVPSRFAVVRDGDYAYRRMRRMVGGMKAYAAFLLDIPGITADDIKRVGTVQVEEIE